MIEEIDGNYTSFIFKQINDSKKKVNILFDFSSLFYRTAYANVENLEKSGFQNWSIVKYRIFDTIINFKNNFKSNDVNLVICLDGKTNDGYWRNKIYPGYKANRKDLMSSIPKNIMSKNFTQVIEDIKENLPWKILRIDLAEADDIISVLVRNFKEDDYKIIHSVDKDLKQLLKFKNTIFYSSYDNEVFETSIENIMRDTFIHILRGDVSDNIPNFLSDLDTFVSGIKRQKNCSIVKATDIWYQYQKNPKQFEMNYINSQERKKRYDENKVLIDLECIPFDLTESIILEYSKCVNKEKDIQKIFNYFLSEGIELNEKIKYI